MHHRGDRDGAGIGAAAPQSRHVVVAVDALKARDDDDIALIQFLFDTVGLHPLDTRRAVGGIRDKARLPPQQRHDRKAELFDRHGKKARGHLLAGGKQHIHLPLGRPGVDLLCLFNQIIRRVPLGRDDDHNVVPLLISLCDNIRDIEKPPGIRNRTAPEFLNDQTHMVLSSKISLSIYSEMISAPESFALLISTFQPGIPRSSIRPSARCAKPSADCAGIIAMMVGPAPLM